MSRIRRFFFLFLSLGCWPVALAAQSHFADCAFNTGNSATLTIPQAIHPAIDGDLLAPGDEIAVFTPDGTCSGSSVWNQKNLGLTIWGDDEQTPPKDGFMPGDTLNFKVWDASTRTEHGGSAINVSYDASQPFHRTDGRYQHDAIYVLSDFRVGTSPTAPTPQTPADKADDLSAEDDVELRWTASANVDTYRVQVATNARFSPTVIDTTNLTETSFSFTELAPQTTYHWRVRATNAVGISAWSPVYRFTTRSADITHAPQLQAPGDNATVSSPLTFGWTAIPEATSYQVRVHADGTVVLDSLGITETSIAGISLADGIDYRWQVRAANDQHVGPWSDHRTFTIEAESPTHAPITELPTDVHLYPNYPNPFNPRTTISFDLPRPMHVTLTVHNVLGQVVATLLSEHRPAGTHRVSWNASSQPSGLYVYRLHTDDRTLARKLTLVR